jgi:hypothetical protein
MSGEGPAYRPSDFVDEDVMEEEEYEAAEAAEAGEGQPEQQMLPEVTPEGKQGVRPNV